MSTPVQIRRATLADAEATAAVHRDSWQWAYRGQIPDAYLAGLSSPENHERREAMWRTALADERADRQSWWVAEDEGRIVGFAGGGPSRDADATPDVGEVDAIYLDQSAAGRGIGRSLFAAAVDDLRRQGYRTATLWVLETNARARRFYEAAGWRPDGTTKTEERPGLTLHEVRYRGSLEPAAPTGLDRATI